MKIQCYSVTVENIVFFIQISDSSDIKKTFALLWEVLKAWINKDLSHK